MAERFTKADWEREHLLAGFDRLHAKLVEWARQAPAWPPFDEAKGLVARLEPRLRVPEIDLDRALVVGFLGGSGTGKSTLYNALLGRRVSRAGKEYRPMTRRAVVACHPDVDPSFLGLDADSIEVHQIHVPFLEQMILIDCPDPDTQDPEDGEGGRRHLDILRAVLPHCDVMVHTVTSQKYKSHVVGQELRKNAPGRQILFVQTHAAIDHDNRADLRKYLDSLGLRVPEIYRFDAADALARQESGEPVDDEFGRFRDLLEHELASRARHRIRRANLLGLYSWLLSAIKTPIVARLEDVAKLEASMGRERTRMASKIGARMNERIDSNHRLWRSRVLRQLNQAWGAGPLAALIGLWSAAGSLVRSLILLRARTPTQAVLAGGLAASQLVAEKWRERRAASALVAEADLGLTEGDLAAARAVLQGYLADAEIQPAATPEAGGDFSNQQLAEVAVEVYQRLDAEVNEVVERRIARRAGRSVHLFFEVLFSLLPAFLVLRLGRNFFIDHLWNDRPLLGLDFFFQSAFWCLAWGAAVGGLLLHWLNRGLDVELKAVVDRLSRAPILDALCRDAADACAAIRAHAVALSAIERDLSQIEDKVGGVLDLGLGALRAEPRQALPHEAGTTIPDAVPLPNAVETKPTRVTLS
ncbi:MAG: GTPase domain-containing protein [Paludisphaera borealis]|uniref:GTPase domain-containing protein n=1 Tax=Paludisphaera borealis TaxID=1387353 RepID=UPI00284D14FB|nr:GTPase domain-containing protein [Paludisphaera borealis]MDR3622591.1 GTPase domain-containing protein [Paludisphaera borealis]